ncbi:unnamed protein product [Linum trigynum]|uniref:Uncharacterized protein n=1 Tax=Linum trigynum TaxID=586398 RepID=A0AAV2D2C6_9ROSI
MKSSTIFLVFVLAFLVIAGNEEVSAARPNQCNKEQLPPYEFKCYKDADCVPGCLAQFGPKAVAKCDELWFRCYCWISCP